MRNECCTCCWVCCYCWVCCCLLALPRLVVLVDLRCAAWFCWFVCWGSPRALLVLADVPVGTGALFGAAFLSPWWSRGSTAARPEIPVSWLGRATADNLLFGTLRPASLVGFREFAGTLQELSVWRVAAVVELAVELCRLVASVELVLRSRCCLVGISVYWCGKVGYPCRLP